MIALLCLALLSSTPAENWPAFRGDGTSVSQAEKLPLEWSETENVAWRQEIPGYGQSSPVVWGPRVFVTSTRGDEKDELLVSAFDARTGELQWTRTHAASQKVKVSDYVSRGAPTPVVDADRVYAFFESGDLLALSHTGEPQWQRSLVEDYGPFQGNHGLGSSLASTDETLIVLVDHAGPSYLLSVDKVTGKNRWKQDRKSRTSWSSPIVYRNGDATEILISSSGTCEGFLAETGERRWWLDGLDGNTVASPSLIDDFVLIGSSKVGQNLAVTRSGMGNVTEQGIRWRATEATSSFGSPLAIDGVAYFINRAGVLFALDAKTGETLWNERLSGSCWASPVAAEGRVYCFGTNGETAVFAGGREARKLAENSLPTEDRVYGIAAVSGAFFIREGSRLTRISLPE